MQPRSAHIMTTWKSKVLVGQQYRETAEIVSPSIMHKQHAKTICRIGLHAGLPSCFWRDNGSDKYKGFNVGTNAWLASPIVNHPIQTRRALSLSVWVLRTCPGILQRMRKQSGARRNTRDMQLAKDTDLCPLCFICVSLFLCGAVGGRVCPDARIRPHAACSRQFVAGKEANHDLH